MNTIDVNPNRFLRHWLATALGAWPVAAVACLIAWVPIALLSSIFAQYESLHYFAHITSTVAIFMVPGISIGYVVGDLQHHLLRDFLDWDFARWIRYSTIGGFLGGLAVILGTFLFGVYLPERIQWMITMPLFILPLSVMQWWILRHVARDAWMWILGNVVAGIVFSGLFFSTMPMPIISAHPFGSLLTWLIAAGSLGIITGIVMLWLYEHPISEWDNDDAELAPVYIEVRNRDE